MRVSGHVPAFMTMQQAVEQGYDEVQHANFWFLNPARVMKHDRETGSIAPQKVADLILVDGDPAARISDIRRVVTVIRAGTLYDAAALYQALGVAPAN